MPFVENTNRPALQRISVWMHLLVSVALLFCHLGFLFMAAAADVSHVMGWTNHRNTQTVFLFCTHLMSAHTSKAQAHTWPYSFVHPHRQGFWEQLWVLDDGAPLR